MRGTSQTKLRQMCLFCSDSCHIYISHIPFTLPTSACLTPSPLTFASDIFSWTSTELYMSTCLTSKPLPFIYIFPSFASYTHTSHTHKPLCIYRCVYIYDPHPNPHSLHPHLCFSLAAMSCRSQCCRQKME